MCVGRVAGLDPDVVSPEISQDLVEVIDQDLGELDGEVRPEVRAAFDAAYVADRLKLAVPEFEGDHQPVSCREAERLVEGQQDATSGDADGRGYREPLLGGRRDPSRHAESVSRMLASLFHDANLYPRPPAPRQTVDESPQELSEFWSDLRLRAADQIGRIVPE